MRLKYDALGSHLPGYSAFAHRIYRAFSEQAPVRALD